MVLDDCRKEQTFHVRIKRILQGFSDIVPPHDTPSIGFGFAQIFAVALRDYGWFISDSSCNAGLQVESGANPTVASLWQQLGVNAGNNGSPNIQNGTDLNSGRSNGNDLLNGLLTTYSSQIYAIAPPTNYCADGTRSVYACPAVQSHYDTIAVTTTPTPTPAPTPAPAPAPTPTPPPTHTHIPQMDPNDQVATREAIGEAYLAP